MKKMSVYIKTVLFLMIIVAVCLCISWIGEIFRAAHSLPWYKLAGAGILLFVTATIAILSLHSDSEETDRRKRRIVIETEFEWGGEVDKYFNAAGIEYEADKADFVRRAAISKAFEENRKREGLE